VIYSRVFGGVAVCCIYHDHTLIGEGVALQGRWLIGGKHIPLCLCGRV